MFIRSMSLIVLAALFGSAAVAQTPAKVPKVGLLFTGLMGGCILSPGLVESFARRGYIEGKTIEFERRPANRDIAKLPIMAADLVARRVDIIITCTYPAAIAAQKATPDTPIVVLHAGDPAETGMVESVAHPAGNMTGVSDLSTILSAKRLQLLKEAIPSLHKVAMLWNEGDLAMQKRCDAAQAEAKKLGLVTQLLPVRTPENFKIAFDKMTESPPDAILVVADGLTIGNHDLVFQYAAAHHLPDMEEYTFLSHLGGLLAYGSDENDEFDRVAALADKILRGAKAGELPLELPTRFHFTVNLKTAHDLGLTIPESTIERSDDVIE